MTPIAAMVQEMLARGVTADIIVLAVGTAETIALSREPQVDATAEKRRAWDRDRKRRKAAPDSTGIPPESPPSLSSSSREPESKEGESERAQRDRSTGTPIDANWQPSEQDRQDAEAIGLTAAEIKTETGTFIDSCLAKGVVSVDWSASWRTWCRRAVNWPGRKPPTSTVTTLPTATSGVWIKLDTPEWHAWREHRGGKPFPIDNRGGWHAPSQWPPGHVSKAA
jgi:hypothetical protein